MRLMCFCRKLEIPGADYIDGEKLGQADRYKLFKQVFGDPETMGNAVLQHLQR